MAQFSLHICVVLLQVSKTVSVHLVQHQLSGRPIYCKPVICRIGFQASFCKKNSTSDYCHLCPQGSKQDQVVDSGIVHYEKDIPKCVRVDNACFLPETAPVFENGKAVRCSCDLSRGFIGDNLFCTKVKSCAPGLELTNTSGRCIPCPHGTYKNTSNYDFCQPHTR
ncbi:uncharacterized protein LOC117314566 [Pecten maximus]|uniref:uncharacterized protein LOC117314566 n=1 Tax=Pecten maximus TaxID=6579 RepID=UPI00145842C9|nr:uncharacterized protein LOC117314566 [Pecten maximus]